MRGRAVRVCRSDGAVRALDEAATAAGVSASASRSESNSDLSLKSAFSNSICPTARIDDPLHVLRRCPAGTGL